MKIMIGDVSYNVYDGVREAFWRKVNDGRWEPETFHVFDKYISGDTTVVDIGAWIGVTSLYAARKSKRVISFEPDSVAFKELSANIRMNPDINNIEINNMCVGIETGKVRISPQNEPGDSSSSILLATDKEGWEVSSIALDGLFAEKKIAEPVFIKMDVEGYEYELAPIIKDLFKKYSVALYLSTHPRVFSMMDRNEVNNKSGFNKILVLVKRRISLLRASIHIARLQTGNIIYNCKGKKINLWLRLWRVLFRKDFTRTHTIIILSRSYPQRP